MRDEKVKGFRSLKPLTAPYGPEDLVLGQYGTGEIDGVPVSAYREEPGVGVDSLTSTFAVMRVFLDNWRWRGVPFILASGKYLSQKLSQLIIHFKEVFIPCLPTSAWKRLRLIASSLGIQPEKKITLTFKTKNPGARSACGRLPWIFITTRTTTAPLWMPMRSL